MNLLSNPSKMPCLGFNIPAFKYCPAAQLMAKVKDKAKKFICDACYACKGFYMFNNVKQSLQEGPLTETQGKIIEELKQVFLQHLL